MLHESVREEIRGRVDRKEYRLDKPLPSAAALASEFEVSSITVKRALRDLQTTGVLRAVPGLGTYVRDRRRFVRDLDFSFNSAEDAKRQNLDLTINLLSISRERIVDPAFSFFEPPGEPMLCVRKLICADGEPIMHDRCYVPLSAKEAIVDDLGRKLVMEALWDQGIQFTGSRLLIDAAPASSEVQENFDVPNGYPTLRRLYLLSTVNPDFRVFGVAEAPFDRLACTVGLNIGSAKSARPKVEDAD